jgi:ubiquitin-protein ligase
MVDSVAPPQARKRLQKDILNTQDKHLRDLGIYYCPDETNIRMGKAMILGPKDTPYEGGIFMFSVLFPVDYPFSPPHVLFLTGDGMTRFHPNLYKEGKVCLSILGTWQGPSWTSTQSLSTVLISIQGLLDANPLANEPSFERGTLSCASHRRYADAVEHQVCSYMVYQILSFERNIENCAAFWHSFKNEIQEVLPSCKKMIRNKIVAREEKGETDWGGLTYGMNIRSKWGELRQKTNGWGE